MAKKEFRRPDEEAMQRVLKGYEDKIEEVILRFAWTMGLSVSDMIDLTWSDVSFEKGEICLEDRIVPMNGDMQRCLQARFNNPVFKSKEFILTSDTRFNHLHRVNLSTYARKALDTEEILQSINLTDLREDFVIRQLEQHDWSYVIRISGLTMRSLYENYSQYMQKDTHSRRGSTAKKTAFTADDEYKLWRLIQEEDTSPVGIALWMIWQLGIKLQELADLTWEQVDLGARVIRLKDRQVQMGVTLERRLRRLYEGRNPEDEPYVLLNPKARRQYGADRLSVVIGEALNRNELSAFDARYLSQVKSQQEIRDQILTYLKEKGKFTKQEIDMLLPHPKNMKEKQIQLMTQAGEIARIGTRYYPAYAVVPPERQCEAILAYLKENRTAQRKALADMLGIEPTQCKWILDNLVKEGKLQRLRFKYYLPGTISPEEEICDEFTESC